VIRRAALLAAGALVLGSCMFAPSTHNASALLHSTAGNMGDIRSGDLFMRLETSTSATPVSGFELKGPFSLESTGDLPVARLMDTHFDGDKKETATFVSTGSKAFAIVKGKTYPLEHSRVAGLSALVRRPGDRKSTRLNSSHNA